MAQSLRSGRADPPTRADLRRSVLRLDERVAFIPPRFTRYLPTLPKSSSSSSVPAPRACLHKGATEDLLLTHTDTHTPGGG